MPVKILIGQYCLDKPQPSRHTGNFWLLCVGSYLRLKSLNTVPSDSITFGLLSKLESLHCFAFPSYATNLEYQLGCNFTNRRKTLALGFHATLYFIVDVTHCSVGLANLLRRQSARCNQLALFVFRPVASLLALRLKARAALCSECWLYLFNILRQAGQNLPLMHKFLPTAEQQWYCIKGWFTSLRNPRCIRKRRLYLSACAIFVQCVARLILPAIRFAE